MGKMPAKIQKTLENDLNQLRAADVNASLSWNDDLKERRLTFTEIAKLIHAGKEDIEIILSPNTRTYWLYSNVLDAYCDMDYEGWEQEEEFINKLVDNGEYLYPLMCWTFGNIDL